MIFDSANSHLIEEAEDGHKKAAGAASCNEDRNLAKGKHAHARGFGASPRRALRSKRRRLTMLGGCCEPCLRR